MVYVQVKEIMGDKVRTSRKLIKLSRDGEEWVSTFETPTGTEVVHSKSIIMTAPGYVAAKLVGGDDGILPEASTLSEGEQLGVNRHRGSPVCRPRGVLSHCSLASCPSLLG